mgnify:FL=1
MTALYIILGILILAVIIAAALLFFDFSVIISIEGKKIKILLKTLGIKFAVPLDKNEKKRRKNEKSEKHEKEETQEKSEDGIMKRFLDLRNNFMRQKNAVTLALVYLRKKIKIEEFGAAGEFGTGNAASTGIAYGTVTAFINTVFGFLGQYFSLKKPPALNVSMNYNKPVFNIRFMFMITAKPYHLLKAFMIYRKNI